MNPAAYQLEKVSKSYRLGDSQIPVLEDLTLEIPAGQFVAIVGPSGSGKSTLMHLLGCLDVASQGRVLVSGHNTADLKDDDLSDLRRKTIGFVFQSFHLISSYDAVDNVALSMVYSRKPNRIEHATDLLTRVGLKHRLHHHPRAMSGGEQQRVAIARAISNDPEILLADEPTGALDQANGRAILDLLQEFHWQGKTIVLVTHDPLVAKRAERVVEMVDGRINDDRINT